MYEMSLSDGASIADSATTASDGVDRRKKKIQKSNVQLESWSCQLSPTHTEFKKKSCQSWSECVQSVAIFTTRDGRQTVPYCGTRPSGNSLYMHYVDALCSSAASTDDVTVTDFFRLAAEIFLAVWAL